MSTAEPFMPTHEPGPEPDPRDRDLTIDVDILREDPTEDADAEAAAARQRARVEKTPFRTPVTGSRISREALEAELDKP